MPGASRRPGRRRGPRCDVEDTAIKELEEETGFTAERIEVLGYFFSSPGMVAEGFTLVRAHGLRRIGEGGGNEHEEIESHLVARDRHPDFVDRAPAEGCAIDVKLLLLLAADSSALVEGHRHVRRLSNSCGGFRRSAAKARARISFAGVG